MVRPSYLPDDQRHMQLTVQKQTYSVGPPPDIKWYVPQTCLTTRDTCAAYSAETNIQRENVTQENVTQRNGRYGGEMLGRRRRRWPNISPPLHQHNVCLLRRHIM